MISEDGMHIVQEWTGVVYVTDPYGRLIEKPEPNHEEMGTREPDT